MQIQTISKKVLQNFYNTHTNLETCKKFGISETTLMKILKKNGIKMKGSGHKKVNLRG